MSGLNLCYEIDNGGGEISYLEERRIKEPLHLANVIAGEIVKEILDNAFDNVTKSNADNVCKMKANAGDVEDEMKKKSEGLGPYDVVTFEPIHAKGGVGDQPFDDKEYKPEITRAVEKKSRVTDLVKNSPQIINEYLMLDEKSKKKQDYWEESEEKMIHVIELDFDGNIEPKTSSSISENNETDILKIPADDGMDIIDLSARAFKEEEKEILNSQLAKGDQIQPVASRNNSTVLEGVTLLTAKESNAEVSDDTNKNKVKKKKWNFGTKFWGFLKKNNKQQSTSTSKIDKQ